MTPVFDVVVRTRFAVGDCYGFPTVPTDDWVDARTALWRQYCLPAMRRQTWRAFQWDLLVHAFHLSRVAPLMREDPRVVVMYQTWGVNSMRTSPFPDHATHRLTVRLDSDDLLDPTYLQTVVDVATVQIQDGVSLPLVMTAPWGYRLDHATGAWYAQRAPNGPFASLLESADHPPVNLYSWSHGALHQRYPVVLLAGTRMWVQVIHGGNKSNGIRADAVRVVAPHDRYPIEVPV